jgi:hypothetical protein
MTSVNVPAGLTEAASAGADLVDDPRGVAGIRRGHEADVGTAGDQLVGDGHVAKGTDRLALGGRGVIDGPFTLNQRPVKSM